MRNKRTWTDYPACAYCAAWSCALRVERVFLGTSNNGPADQVSVHDRRLLVLAGNARSDDRQRDRSPKMAPTSPRMPRRAKLGTWRWSFGAGNVILSSWAILIASRDRRYFPIPLCESEFTVVHGAPRNLSLSSPFFSLFGIVRDSSLPSRVYSQLLAFQINTRSDLWMFVEVSLHAVNACVNRIKYAFVESWDMSAAIRASLRAVFLSTKTWRHDHRNLWNLRNQDTCNSTNFIRF